MNRYPVHVYRAELDPTCVRVSVGGGDKTKAVYCTYRGAPAECIEVLKAAVQALEVMQASGKEPPVNRKIPHIGLPGNS